MSGLRLGSGYMVRRFTLWNTQRLCRDTHRGLIKEKGKAILEAAVNELVQLINDLRSGKLPMTKIR